MKVEVGFFAGIGVFFLGVGLLYGFWSGWVEPVGWVALHLCAGLGFMIAFYLWAIGRKLPARPEDNEHGEIHEQEGAYGAFSPYSWWPLWLALSATLVFLGVAVAYWLAAFGLIMGVWAVCGWTFEYFKGEFAH